MIHKSYMTAKKILWKAYLMALENVDVQLALAKFTFFSWKISRDFVEKDRLKNIYMFTVAMAHDTAPPHPADCVVSSVLLFFSFFYCVFHWGGGGGALSICAAETTVPVVTIVTEKAESALLNIHLKSKYG